MRRSFLVDHNREARRDWIYDSSDESGEDLGQEEFDREALEDAQFDEEDAPKKEEGGDKAAEGEKPKGKDDKGKGDKK